MISWCLSVEILKYTQARFIYIVTVITSKINVIFTVQLNQLIIRAMFQQNKVNWLEFTIHLNFNCGFAFRLDELFLPALFMYILVSFPSNFLMLWVKNTIQYNLLAIFVKGRCSCCIFSGLGTIFQSLQIELLQAFGREALFIY